MPQTPIEATRVARLTHAQYDATVQALLGITETPARLFAPDALDGFQFDSSIGFRVDARLGPQYRSAAEGLAERAVAEDEIFSRIVECSPTDAGCSDEFIESFGQKAFRRPLTSDEAQRFAALFSQGGELVQSGDDFRDGVRLVVEAALQSPQFLYRTEVSNEVGSDGRIALDDWEIASRLSYFLYNSMPDSETFSAASNGALHSPDEIRNAVARMLEDPRATRQLVSFHEQAWHFRRYSTITPDPDTYPEVPDDIVARVRAASSRFVQEVIDTGGGLVELLTAPYAFADAGLAPLYGSDITGNLQRIDFDPSERKGLLMQIGFLASNAYAIETDPIHRGLFVVRDLLCREIGDPPPGASMSELPSTPTPPETTREEVTLLTGQLACVGCHMEINDPGFSFEGFDAVGQIRTTQNGVPVDTTGSMTIDGVDISFSGPFEVVDQIAASEEARRCYAAKWLTFAYGRELRDAETAIIEALSQAPLSVGEIAQELASSAVFASREPNEVGP